MTPRPIKTVPDRLHKNIPVLPLKDVVVYPHSRISFLVGRAASVKAVDEAMSEDRMIFLACQKSETETPREKDLYKTGTIAQINRVFKLPDGTIKVLVEGRYRAEVKKIRYRSEVFRAKAQGHVSTESPDNATIGLMAKVQNAFTQYAEIKKLPSEQKKDIERAETPQKCADLVCAHLKLSREKKIQLLLEEDQRIRLEDLAVSLEAELEMARLNEKIHGRVKRQLEKTQKDYYLNEQLKQIHKELGQDDPSGADNLSKTLKERQPPEYIREKAEKEIARLKKLQPISPEAGILRHYVEWLVELPWQLKNESKRPDIKQAETILDEDHYGMKKPKDRILDYIAVRSLSKKLRGPILCFIGPPGTGKTSLGKSVARALDRDFVRISLGGVRDEAEIRGHRKTYVGALPGKILQGMRKAGSMNPVFLLDEIDKMSSDYRGDPASALLEVLDPEQNREFMDHYLEVPYDLSNVLFITTANSMHTIPDPLRDRMEIIEITGYSDLEKLQIAKQFLVPKQIMENGLEKHNIMIQDSAILDIINDYTMESGVRTLERTIASVIRKSAREILERDDTYKQSPGIHAQNIHTGVHRAPARKVKGKKTGEMQLVTSGKVREYLGPKTFFSRIEQFGPLPGLVYGLAWTQRGGTILPIESTLVKGEGDFTITGNLGDVMKESARIAYSFIQSQSECFKLDSDVFTNQNVHIHIPEGAIPKDGPSAGITLFASLVSVFTGNPIKQGWAMTGELTLTGQMLPVGGIREKVLAAHRNGLNNVLVPEANKKDLEEIPQKVLDETQIHFSKTALGAIGILFEPDFVSQWLL